MRRATVLLAICLVGSGAVFAGVSVEVSEKPGVDYSAYETYAWKIRADLHADHHMAEGSEADLRIRRLAGEALADSGFELVDIDAADLWINYVTYDKDLLQIEGTTQTVAGSVKWIGDPDAHSMRNYLEGTLVFEVVDAKTGKMVWSGWASGAASTREKLRAKAPKAIKKIFHHFPPD